MNEGAGARNPRPHGPGAGVRYDVIVVGGSIAGASLAIGLAERGRSVFLLDKAGFPRHKPCGEGLMPEGVAILDGLGVVGALLARGARPFRGMRFRSLEGVWAEAEFPSSPRGADHGLVLPRRELDHALFERARACPNVEAREGFRVVSLRVGDGGVQGVRGHPSGHGELEESFEARLTVGADGIHSLFHDTCGLSRTLLRRRRFGVTGHFAGVAGLGDRVEVLIQPRGEIYVAPGPGDVTLVALLLEEPGMSPFRGALEGSYESFVRRAPGLAERMASAELVPPVSAVGPLGFTLDRCSGPGFLLVGDAAGFLDPISGMGMTLALKSVEAALPVIEEALATGDRSARALARYDALRAEAVDDAVRLTRLLLALTRHRPLAGRAVRRLGRDPDLFGKLLGVVTGTRRWREVRLREKLALLRG
ncbi:MAG: NAD(P)/FAD-dependent oxidoreductase [Gemmatimonadota bacterium]